MGKSPIAPEPDPGSGRVQKGVIVDDKMKTAFGETVTAFSENTELGRMVFTIADSDGGMRAETENPVRVDDETMRMIAKSTKILGVRLWNLRQAGGRSCEVDFSLETAITKDEKPMAVTKFTFEIFPDDDVDQAFLKYGDNLYEVTDTVPLSAGIEAYMAALSRITSHIVPRAA